VHALLNPQRGAGVAQRVESILCRARLINDPGSDLQWLKASLHYVAVRLDAASAGRENKVQFALGTNQLPFPKAVENNRRHRDRPISRLRFEAADLVEHIGTLAHVDLS